jgi:hypothetical protein
MGKYMVCVYIYIYIYIYTYIYLYMVSIWYNGMKGMISTLTGTYNVKDFGGGYLYCPLLQEQRDSTVWADEMSVG